MKQCLLTKRETRKKRRRKNGKIAVVNVVVNEQQKAETRPPSTETTSSLEARQRRKEDFQTAATATLSGLRNFAGRLEEEAERSGGECSRASANRYLTMSSRTNPIEELEAHGSKYF